MADTNNKILFRQGSYAGFKGLSAHSAGTLYFTTDEGGLYLGTGTGANDYKRIQGSVLYFNTLDTFNEAVVENPPYAADVLYFVADEDALVRYDEGSKKWVQLNVTVADFNELAVEVHGTDGHGGLVKSIADNATNIALNAGDIDALEKSVKALEDLAGIGGGEAGTSLSDRITALETWVEEEHPNVVNELTAKIENIYTPAITEGDTTTPASGVLVTEIAAAKKYTDDSIAPINTSITQINSALDGKASANDLDSLEKYVKGDNKDGLGGLDAKVTKNTEDIAKNVEDIANLTKNKAEASAVSTLKGRVDGHDTDIVNIRTSVNNIYTPADTENGTAESGVLVDKINNAVKDLATKEEVEEITNILEDSTDETSGVTTKGLVSRVEDLENTVGDSTDGLVKRVNDHDTAIASKASAQSVADLTEVVNGKASQEDLNTANDKITALEEAVNGKEGTDGLAKKVSDLETNKADKTALESLSKEVLGENQDGTGGLKQGLADANTAITQANGKITALEEAVNGKEGTPGLVDKVSDLEDVINGDTGLAKDIEDLKTNKADATRVDYLEGVVGTDATKGLQATVAGHTTSIDNLNTAVATKAEKTYVDEQIGVKATQETPATGVYKYVDDEIVKVQNAIDSEIEAANAMVFKGSVNALEQPDPAVEGVNGLPKENVSIGDTYVVSSQFGSYQAGDLLIATGTEIDGVIDPETLSWQHIKTGYVDVHESKLSAEDNTIKLVSHVGTDLGKVAIKSNNANLVVNTVSTDVLTQEIQVDMVWDTWDTPAAE